MSFLQRLRFQARFRYLTFKRWFTLDTAVAVLLALTLAGSGYTALGIRRIVDAERRAAIQHEHDSRQRASNTRAAIDELKTLLTVELARALEKHDRAMASMLEATLARLERLLGRPASIIEHDRETVIVRTPAPTQPKGGRHGRARR